MRHVSTTLLISLLALLPIQAQDEGEGNAGSKASFLSDHQSIAPGSTFSVALHLCHPKGWHSYYRNSGGIELPPEISWTLPNGFEAEAIQWPVPKVKDGDFGTSFIYRDKLTLVVDITTSDALEIGSTAAIKAEAMWQICDTGCINEEREFELQLAITENSVLDPGSEELFKQARAKLPTSSKSWTFSATEAKESVTLTFKAGDDFAKLPTDFIPDQPFVNAASKGGKIERDGDSITIQLPRKTMDAFDEPIDQGNAISGILVGANLSALVPLTEIGGDRAANTHKPEPAGFGKLFSILGGMFIGGLILNLMPCVFPVIGLKIMGFVQQAGEDKKKIILHGVTFTVGVMASFAVLSGILFTARSAAGEAVGWGYQLQNPWVVIVLMLLMFILALNMFGLFEIGASATSIGGNLQSKQGLSGSFFSGILATVVATPCSAPFLGAAIGAAIALPAVQFFSAFGSMALGLSAPYLILSIFPKLIDFLPRPGAWMESFKQAMSFLLFATTGYLMWVYAGQIGLDQILSPIFGLTIIGTAGWIHGRWNLPNRSKRTRGIALALTILLSATGLLLAKPPNPSALEWKAWSPETQERLVEQGTPVYVDYTAQWCVTCQVNKKRAYTDEVIAKFNEYGVVALKADKTKPSEAIERALGGYGRTAIPVNVLLIPGKEPIILPELLGPRDVLEAMANLDNE